MTNVIKFVKSNGAEVLFKLSNFDESDINIDKILSTDYSNLIGEIITFPVILNRLGLLLADADDKLRHSELNLKIKESKLFSELMKDMSSRTSTGSVRKPSKDEVENLVQCDKVIQVLYRNKLKAEKIRNYINSIYWAAKAKSNNLEKLSLSIRSGDIESKLIESKINGILIKHSQPLI